ncbi:kinectin-like isoform X2 [Tachysurus fulvidraco]|uniref:kinectin-like isoform X2 n=1 Tax=Tachysurus fulvidraco TaxID=1234273 RepID=UPI001FED8094|nr:kinectin-like isoform X2 [Tachysurus fulvidraco]
MSEFREKMSKDSLIELLNQSIDSTEGSVVNFKTLHLLLYNLVNRHGAERETEDGREADVRRDVTERLSDSDTSEQLEDSKEGVSKVISSTSLMQDLVKQIQELKGEADNLKEEVGILRDQLNQELKDNITSPGFSDTSREVFPTKKDQIQEMDKSLDVRLEHLEGLFEEFSKSLMTASQGSDGISGSEQQLYLQTADLRNSFHKLDKEMQNVKQELLVLIMEQKRSSENEIQDKELKDSIIGPGFSDTSREVNSKDQLQEIIKCLVARVEHLEGVFEEFSKSLMTASQGSDGISGSEQQLYLQTADLRNSFHKLDKEMQNVKQELLVLIKEQKRSSEKEIQDKELKDSIITTGFSVTSREVNVFVINELEARVEHLEGVFEVFSKSLMTASQGSDGISGSEQQLYLQTANLRNSFQRLDKKVENLKQELLLLIKEQKRSSEKEIQDKELKDSIIGPGFSDTSQEVNVFQTNKDQLQEMEKRLVARVEHLEGVFEEFSKSLVTASQGSDGISGSEQQLYLQTADLRNSFHKLDKEMQNVKQELLVLIKEQKRSSEKEIQDKELKDSIMGLGFSDTSNQLQEMDKRLEARVEPLEGEREYILSPGSVSESSGEIEELSKSKVTASRGSESISGSEQQLHLQTADLRNSFQKLDEEMQNVKQKLQEQKEITEKEMQDKLDSLHSIQDNMSLKTNELFQFFENLQSIVTGLINDIATEKARDVHGTVLQLQAECEKLYSTTNQLMKEQEQEQSHTKDLYKITKELEEKKADKDEVKIVEDFKAEMQTLEAKVLLCDTAADQLNRMIQDIASNICEHEENSQRVNEKIFSELDCKLNYTELDGVKRQLEECKMKIFQLDTQTTESYDAAVIRKHCLSKFKCLSCDRPVNMSNPRPSMLVMPEPPGLPRAKHHIKTRLRQWTILDQSEKSPTSRSIEKTRETDRCGFEVNKKYQDTSYVKAADVRVTFPPATEGCYKNKSKVSQLLTSSGRKPRRQLLLRDQGPNKEMICTGLGCLENNRQWYPEDSFPPIPRS